jgi:hypothetical protein
MLDITPEEAHAFYRLHPEERQVCVEVLRKLCVLKVNNNINKI